MKKLLKGAGIKHTYSELKKTRTPVLCVFHFDREHLYHKSESVLWPKFGAQPLAITESEEEYKELNLQWSESGDDKKYKQFQVKITGRRSAPLPLSLMEVHKLAIDRKKQHDVNCFINADNNNNQLVLTRSIPFDGEVGLASATIKLRLGRWECVVQAGGNILEPFAALDFESNLRKNLYAVMEMLGERNGWKCCYGYKYKNKIEFGAECKGVFKSEKHTNSRTYNVCNKCTYKGRTKNNNKDSEPQKACTRTPYNKRTKENLISLVVTLKEELAIIKKRLDFLERLHEKDAVEAENELPPIGLIEKAFGDVDNFDASDAVSNPFADLLSQLSDDNGSIVKDFMTEQMTNLIKIKKGDIRGVRWSPLTIRIAVAIQIIHIIRNKKIQFKIITISFLFCYSFACRFYNGTDMFLFDP